MMLPEPSLCPACREQRARGDFLLPVLDHPDCLAVVRAEQRAARRFGVRFTPGGCAVGSTWAGRFDTSDKVHKEFVSKPADRLRERAEGWRHEVLTHDEWDQRAKPCLTGQCRHEVAGRGE